MWPFNKRKWILVIGIFDKDHVGTDIRCYSKDRYECLRKALKEIELWMKHKQEVFGGQLISDDKMIHGLRFWTTCLNDYLYEQLEKWSEDFQDTRNLVFTWESSHLEIFKISVRIFSSESDFIKF